MMKTEQSGTASVIPVWEKPFFLVFPVYPEKIPPPAPMKNL
jgi:hypothetical protein